jgi:hypothetical protein
MHAANLEKSHSSHIDAVKRIAKPKALRRRTDSIIDKTHLFCCSLSQGTHVE